MKRFTLILLLCSSMAQAQSIADMKDLIEMLCRQDSCDEAFSIIAKAQSDNPNNDTLHYYQGWLKLTCLHDYNSALLDFDKGLSINPKSAFNHLGKGACLSKTSRANEALLHLHTAKKLNSKLPELNLYLGYAYFLLGSENKNYFTKALRYLDKSVKVDFDKHESFLYQAIAHHHLGNHKKALLSFGHYEDRTVDGQRDSLLYLYGGISNFMMGNYDIAENFLTIYLEKRKPTTEILYYRGLARVKQGLMGDALVDLKKFIDENPNNADIQYDIAQGFFSSEELEMGYVYWDKAAKMGHKKSIDIVEKYKASFTSHQKNLGSPISFSTDKYWLVDEFNDSPSVSSCNGIVFNSLNARITFAIVENEQLLTNPNASCAMWEKELRQDGAVDTFTTSSYCWIRTISADNWESSAEAYGIKVIKRLPIVPKNQIMVYIWGKPEDMEVMDFYINNLLESIRIGQ